MKTTLSLLNDDYTGHSSTKMSIENLQPTFK